MPSLLLLTGPLAGRRFDLSCREEAVIGRGAGCALVLRDPKVSRRHARVFRRDGALHVEDLGSRNGTFVRGERIEGAVALAPGVPVEIGATTLLCDAPSRVGFGARAVTVRRSRPVEPAGELDLHLARRLIAATSQAQVLRAAVDTVVERLGATRAAAALADAECIGIAETSGDERVEVPRALAEQVLASREVVEADGCAAAPLGGVGVVYVEREGAWPDGAGALLATVALLAADALQALRARPSAGAAPGFVGGAGAFGGVLEALRRAAIRDDAVLLWGEPGTGKRTLAAHLHALSSRAGAPCIFLDCRLPSDVLAAELDHAVPSANGGTLVLVHLEAVPPQRAEELAARLPGAGVRVTATSTRPLPKLRAEGLAPDLAEALEAHAFAVPPLRERTADVPALFDHLAHEAAARSFHAPPTLTPDARRLMADYPWPGNVEELRLVAERLALLYPGQEIPSVRLPPELQQGSIERPRSLDSMLSRVEREAVAEALHEARGKKIRAAELLGISRPTLDKKIADYGLTVDRPRPPSRRTP